jgi:large subunit ribosomal protein L23
MNVIIGPLITEKSMMDAGKGKFTFRVAKSAGKNDIKKEVETNFKVSVTHISTSILKGKSLRTGRKRAEKALPATKKAVVTLKKGEKIGLFELGGDNK